MLQHRIIQSMLCYLSSGHFEEVKHKIEFQTLAPNVVAFAHERLQLTRGLKINIVI